MSVLFGDTFYWIALADLTDSAHQRAMTLTVERKDSLIVTTDEVLAEYLTFFATAPEQMRRKAVTNAQRILENPGVRVVPQSRESFLAGMALYGSRPDKGYSLTDCISMQTMRKEGLRRLLPTTDTLSKKVSGRCFATRKPVLTVDSLDRLDHMLGEPV